MAYAPAVWLAVQEQVFRTSSYVTSISTITTHVKDRSLARLFDRFDDAFLLDNFHFNRPCLIFISDLIRTSLSSNANFQPKDTQHVDAMVLLALHFYAKGILPRKIMDLVGLDAIEATDGVNTVSKLLAGMAEKFITFPGSHNDRVWVALAVKDLCGIPNAAGVLRCMHVKVTPPADNPILFNNTLNYTSVMVQTISDVDGNLLSVEKCSPGGTPPQQVWESSVICQQFMQGYHGPTWVIGGEEYQLSQHLLTPKHPSEIQSRAVRSYNEAHSEVLSCSLGTIGSLKTRFRCLQDLGPVHSSSLDRVSRVIYACCVLHNIAKKFSVPLPEELVPEPIHPVPESPERLRGTAMDTRVAEVLQKDVIMTCFQNHSGESSRLAGGGGREEGES